MKYLLISLTLTTCVNATIPFLGPRQSLCDEGDEVCANGCIPNSYSCCLPAAASGCEPGTANDRSSNTDNEASDQYTDYGNTESTGAYDAGACSLIDGTVGYLMVGAMALLL
ncbi:unnamed protein product [Fusarium venenatum]|uniref:Hydrophobin n=1 Tax=Fusarium venenatum TaxID=56646 RepID=A0A2L2SYS1_9HYPO|nr:uncharacterized protein FVRRES_07650 [Fusarium venenatum]KAH6994550.1 hypothetical protein EDB82DRAFT_537422 [Fusarium venenatum]CEI63214.1 unnamed protein product [Fusarium venenatum]